jgi:3-hydroxyisobutyrate dehydrogenase
MSMRFGYVGIGNMGGPMAANLARSGNEVIIGDLNKAAVDAFTAEHETARPANGLAAVGQDADAVFTCLPNGKIVREAILGDGGVAEGMAEGSVLVDMSSSAPGGTIELGKELAERGIRMVDAPVSGGVPRAIEGTIAIMVGGEKEDIEKVRPALETMGGQIFETGGLGSAHAMKSINNVLSATNLVVAIEALTVGKKFGLDPDNMVDILNFSSGKNSATEGKLKQYILSRNFASGFAMDLMLKDVRTALDLADDMKVPWMIGSAVHEMIRAARNNLTDNADYAEIGRWIEQNADIEL